MKRLFFPLLGVALTLGACGNDKTTETTTTTEATNVPSEENAAPAMSADSADGMKADATAPAAGMADPNGPTAPHATDAEFLMSAAHSDQNEIQQSKMALAKGVTGMAKEMADKMIADHTKSTADLKVIAAKMKVTLPTDMDAEHKAMAPAMEKLAGKDFEAKYLAQMVTDHQKTANTLAAHEKMTQDADIKGFIAKTLPVVESHLSMAKQGDMKM